MRVSLLTFFMRVLILHPHFMRVWFNLKSMRVCHYSFMRVLPSIWSMRVWFTSYASFVIFHLLQVSFFEARKPRSPSLVTDPSSFIEWGFLSLAEAKLCRNFIRLFYLLKSFYFFHFHLVLNHFQSLLVVINFHCQPFTFLYFTSLLRFL